MNDGPNILDARDPLETAILLALHGKDMGQREHRVGFARERAFGDTATYTVHTPAMFCPRQPEFPREAYTFDMADADDRLFTSGLEYVVVDPVLAIGNGLETMVTCQDGSLKWTKFSPMPAPRGLVAVGPNPSWFAVHFRQISEGQPDTYIRKPMALSRGRPCLLKPMGFTHYNAGQERDEIEVQLALTLSIMEDAIRVNSFLASVEEAVRLRFPVGAAAYKDFLLLRDAPRDTPTGRLNPIVHWVRKHLRQTASGGLTSVSSHLRGVEQIEVGPMRLTIEKAPGYEGFIR